MGQNPDDIHWKHYGWKIIPLFAGLILVPTFIIWVLIIVFGI